MGFGSVGSSWIGAQFRKIIAIKASAVRYPSARRAIMRMRLLMPSARPLVHRRSSLVSTADVAGGDAGSCLAELFRELARSWPPGKGVRYGTDSSLEQEHHLFGLSPFFEIAAFLVFVLIYGAGLVAVVALGVVAGALLTAYLEPFIERVRRAGRDRFHARASRANPGEPR